jgi:hypothetical protein
MKQPQAHRPKVRSHELLVMSKLCELYATLPPERRMRVHEHIAGMLDDLPTVVQVQPAIGGEDMFGEVADGKQAA